MSHGTKRFVLLRVVSLCCVQLGDVTLVVCSALRQLAARCLALRDPPNLTMLRFGTSYSTLFRVAKHCLGLQRSDLR